MFYAYRSAKYDGPVDLHSRSFNGDETQPLLESLVFGPGNVFPVREPNDLTIRGLVIEGNLVNSFVARIGNGIESSSALWDGADLPDEPSCDRAMAGSEAYRDRSNLEGAVRVIGIRSVPFADEGIGGQRVGRPPDPGRQDDECDRPDRSQHHFSQGEGFFLHRRNPFENDTPIFAVAHTTVMARRSAGGTVMGLV